MRGFIPLSLLVGALVAPLYAQTATDPMDLGFDNGGEWVSLRVDGSRLGLRFDPALTEHEVRQLLSEMPAVAPGSGSSAWYQPGQTVYVDTVEGTTAQDAWSASEFIREMPGVWSASPRMYALEDPYYLTEEILVRWHPSASMATREALTEGLRETALLEYKVNPGHVYRVPAGEDPLERANAIAASGWAEFSIPDFQLLRVPYGIVNDPLHGDQWHLDNTGQNGAVAGNDMNVNAAWNITMGDPSVIVAIVDTGVELGHPDLVNNLVQGIDVLSNDNDPRAENGFLGLFPESHSTSVHGVVAAEANNGQGGTGVAPNCRLMPIRFLSEFLWPSPSTQDEADAFNFACNNGAAIINNSWGPLFGAVLPASTKAAIDNCVQNGRNGLGTIVFFAAGNAGNNNSNNGYVTYSGTTGVTASNDQGVKSGYSSFGPFNDINGPSDGGRNKITTTDRLGSRGYSNGDYTNGFGGTSAASPNVAGVMALILSANPALERLEALSILFSTAQKIDVAGAGYNAFGHSDKYGYGRADAGAAVAMAASGILIDTISLTGDTQAQVGDNVAYSFTGAPGNAPFEVYAGFSLGGTIIGAQLFDVGVPYSTVGSGVTNAAGAGSWAGGPIPSSAAGRTVYVEVGALIAGEAFDSNVVPLSVN